MTLQTDYAMRFPKSDGGYIEYVFHAPSNTVTSTAVVTGGTMTLEAIDNNLQLINRWAQSIYQVFSPPRNDPPDTNASIELEIETDKLVFKPKSGSFQLDFTYTYATGLITALPRPAFDVSWSSFLSVLDALRVFVARCRGQWKYSLVEGVPA